MSLCRFLHAAFGRSLLGVHPSYVIHVRRDILEEVDGPMLRHGLQGLEGQRILVPSRRVERPDEGSFWGWVRDGSYSPLPSLANVRSIEHVEAHFEIGLRRADYRYLCS